MKRIVVIGGGTGTFTVLQGLRNAPIDVTAIVSTADDGGSTGVLRDELGVLPPGDVRQALVALAEESQLLRKLFTYRFPEGTLAGHSFGNLFLSALEKVTGSFDAAILEAGRILAVRGRVLPVTRARVHLAATFTNRTAVHGEHAIERAIWNGGSVRALRLEPRCVLHPLAGAALREADLIVFAPGSVFTSILPNLLVGGMLPALRAARAPLAAVVNLMTERGHTDRYAVQDFADLLLAHLGGRKLDYVVFNNRIPPKALLARYRKETERLPVRVDRKRIEDLPYELIGADLLSRSAHAKPSPGDRLAKERTLIRHDPEKVSRVLLALAHLADVRSLKLR